MMISRCEVTKGGHYGRSAHCWKPLRGGLPMNLKVRIIRRHDPIPNFEKIPETRQ